MVQLSGLFLVAIAFAVVAMMLLPKQTDPKLEKPIEIIDDNEQVEKLLTKYTNALGDDYDSYKAHIYRVLTYSIHFLEGDTSNLNIIASALVFHDIGLWADKQLGYIKPSCKRAKAILKTQSFTPRQISLAQDIIYWHHKFTDYESDDPYFDRIINAVRKADWIDATGGLIKHGMPASHINKVNKAIPVDGFHQRLLVVSKKLMTGDFVGSVSGIFSVFKL